MSGMEHFTLGTGHGYRGLLQVGLVNAMPDTLLRATELQFARLLKDAAGALDVRLRLFSPGGMARSDEMRGRMEGFYDDTAFLPAAGLDAVIIAAPDASDNESADADWTVALAQLLDWAQATGTTAILSGGAVPAALLHMDAITARPLTRPLCGVYSGQRAMDDPLFFHTAWDAGVPHMRTHGFADADLSARGIRVLSRLSDGSPDMLSRDGDMLFLQGHPEHDDGAPGQFYLRKMARFFAGEIAARPVPPQHYFDRATESRLLALGDDASLAHYIAIVQSARTMGAWRGQAVRLFANWLTLTAAAKTRRAASRAVHTRRRAT